MQKDITDTPLFKEARDIYQSLYNPGSGLVADAVEVDAAPDASSAVFTGTLVETLDAPSSTRICSVDITSGDVRVLTFGPNSDRLPKYSPDGNTVAFLSDRGKKGDFQLYLFDLSTSAVSAAPVVEGWVEYFHWSPSGHAIVLGVAGHGADISGGQGAVTSKKNAEADASWLPVVETGDENFRWRSAWVYDCASQQVSQISQAGLNTWEINWSGNDQLLAVTSPSPNEGDWYSATLNLIDLSGGNTRTVYTPKDQLGWPSANPSAQRFAIVEAVCSDRWVVAGELLLIDADSGDVEKIDTQGIDVSYTEWRSDHCLAIAGVRSFETVIAEYDCNTKVLTEIWVNREISCGSVFFPSMTGLGGSSGDYAFISKGFMQSPAVAMINQGQYQSVVSFDHTYNDLLKNLVDKVEAVTWSAPDGLEIEGWLLHPKVGSKPYPLVMEVHGGPVGQYRSAWLGKNAIHVLMLLQKGYAVLRPNPRGSAGRGIEFARKVKGDMGGADTYDYLSGLDYLVDKGLCDPERMGVMGVSYGGFMSSWLITQDTRFAAAIPVSPVTNHVTEHLTSNIPYFVSLFLDDHYTNPTGKYFERSPIMHAHKAKTPTLNICGALDRCTPPEEAMQFHNALLENNMESVLLTYPEEGHGVRSMPATIDYAARVVDWFEKHMPANQYIVSSTASVN